MVHVRHAERGAVERIMRLDEFISDIHANHGCFDGSDDGKMIDQAFQPRVSERIIRVYMVHDRVGGFGHQAINALHPDTPVTDHLSREERDTLQRKLDALDTADDNMEGYKPI